MLLKFQITTALLFLSYCLYAQQEHQINIGLESNSQYYVDDAVTGDFEESDNFRSNNYLKLDYSYGKFVAGIQLESYAPQSLLDYSPSFNKQFSLGTYHIAYTTKKWSFTLGHFYDQFGNGLIFRSWEDRQLGINNAVRGAKIAFTPSDKISIKAIVGQQRVGFEVSEGVLFGVDSEFDISKLASENTSLSIGLGYLGRHQSVETVNDEFKPTTHAISGRLNYAKNNFYSSIEGVLKSKDALIEEVIISDDKLFFGNAILLNLGYSKKGFGINTSLRRMENMNFYSDREASGNLYNEQIINYLPGLTKQHDYSLSNIYVYQSQPELSFNPLQKSGEIGGQIDIYYQLKKGTTLGGKRGMKIALNFASWYGLGAAYNSEYRRVDVGLFSFGEHYFSDFNIEFRKKINKKVSGIFTYINSFYNKEYIEGGLGKINSSIVITESTYKFNSKRSTRLELQHLWTKDDQKNWVAGTTEFNINRNFSCYITDMYNYGNSNEQEKNHYYNFGGSFSKNKTRLALSYGRQRGGLLCVGGVCREVPAATGITFNVTTSF